MPIPSKYYAFISYKREDEKWAKWLQRKLESYRLPATVCHQNPDLPRRLKIFKDTTDIKPGVLADVLTDNLRNSRYLIVICSPQSAKSQWVGKEISEFVAQGKTEKILLFIVAGKPYSNDAETECYHPVIKNLLPEMLGINIHEAGRESRFIKRRKAFIRLLSSLLDLSFDSLWKRQQRRMIRQGIIAFLVAALFAATVITVWMINKPFDMEVTMKETSLHNGSLPFENGKIGLVYDDDTLYSRFIDSYDDIAEFCDIPGKYKNKDVRLLFEMFGFENVDTVIRASEEIRINIIRDDTWGIFQGIVYDENMQFIDNAIVSIDEFHVVTDENGSFILRIPISRQAEKKTMKISKEGFKDWEYLSEPSHFIKRKIMIEPK